MLKLKAKSMTNAIQKARSIRPKVRVINADNRTYAVYGSRCDAYTVNILVADVYAFNAGDRLRIFRL